MACFDCQEYAKGIGPAYGKLDKYVKNLLSGCWLFFTRLHIAVFGDVREEAFPGVFLHCMEFVEKA